MFYKLVMECGHVGAGNDYDKVWYIKGRDPMEIMRKARRLPGVKKKNTTLAVKMIQQITRKEYINGIIAKREALCA